MRYGNVRPGSLCLLRLLTRRPKADRVSDEQDEDSEASEASEGEPTSTALARRFRGFLPVVIDVETGGFEAETDALLEIGASIIDMDANGDVVPGPVIFHHVKPFPNARLDPQALAFTGIDPWHPFRFAVDEHEAITDLFRAVRRALRKQGCQRAVVVAHNAAFDHGFLRAAVSRAQIKRNPFHPFSSFDTATLAALVYGQTVLRRACDAADIEFSSEEAHTARYDTEKTAELFCAIVNRYRHLGGWPVQRRGAGRPLPEAR